MLSFSILGYNNNQSYGDIQIIFSSAIKCHPNFFVLPVAATKFYSGEYGQYRPWIKSKKWTEGGKKAFEESKLHPCEPDTNRVLALELVFRISKELEIKQHKVSLDDVKKYYKQLPSDYCFEGHIPIIATLNYVEQVIIPTNAWSNLPPETKLLAMQYFGDKIIWEDHVSYPKIRSSSIFTGYCFTISQKSTSIFPVNYSELKLPVSMIFKTTGQNFRITLEQKGKGHIILDKSNARLKITTTPEKKKPTEYNVGDDIYSYQFRIERTKITITTSHKEHIHTTGFTTNLTSINFISFKAHKEPCTFIDFLIEAKSHLTDF